MRPFLVPICFVGAWALIFLVAWSVYTAIRDALKQAARMHQIPCANCQFFTDNYSLKCAVHPTTALTEAAIHCSDFRDKNNPFTALVNSVTAKDVEPAWINLPIGRSIDNRPEVFQPTGFAQDMKVQKTNICEFIDKSETFVDKT